VPLHACLHRRPLPTEGHRAFRSVKQACEILSRRTDAASEQIKDHEAALDVLVEQKLLTEQLIVQLTPKDTQGEQLVDIREEYADPPEPEPATARPARMPPVPANALPSASASQVVGPATPLSGMNLYGMEPGEFVKEMLPLMELGELRATCDDVGLPQPPLGTRDGQIREILRRHLASASTGAMSAVAAPAPIAAQPQQPLAAPTVSGGLVGLHAAAQAHGAIEPTRNVSAPQVVASAPVELEERAYLEAVEARKARWKVDSDRRSETPAAAVATPAQTTVSFAGGPDEVQLTEQQQNGVFAAPPARRVSKFKAARMAARGE
jgi:hypothetical protein